MSGINFRTSNFQVNTKLQRATVNNQKNEQEETKPAEKETKKPQVKLNIQTSGLNALGRYNMVSVNTTAKRATLKPASANLKPASNSGDGKVNNEQEAKYKYNDFESLRKQGKLQIGDYTLARCDDDMFFCKYIDAKGKVAYYFGTEKEVENFGKDLGK